MSLYKCVVYDENEKKKSIKLNLTSEDEIEYYVKSNNLRIVSIEEVKFNKKSYKLKDKDLKILCKKMSILLQSGCEITKIFDILKSESNLKIKSILNYITNQIYKGNSISESFQRSKSFSNFFTSMINTGEVSGNLDKSLSDLSDYYDKEYKLKSKIILILIYPVMLIFLSMASMTFILFFIVPNFEIIFESNGINPPIMTKILINISKITRENYALITIILFTSICITNYSINYTHKGKALKNILKFKVPIIKDINKLIVTSKFCRSFSILMRSGIQITDAIDISSKVIDNGYIYNNLKIANDYINRGNSIASSLKKTGIFPQLFISMISIGEESGRLDSSLDTINEYYENELDIKTQQFVKIIEPAITIIIGAIVAIFIVSMVLPMFDAITAI